MTSKQWMIYGANGYTGELIAREARERGLSPVLAGRSEAKLAPLGEELGLQVRSFSLDQPNEVQAALQDITLVLHCAGPFSATAEPMIDACLAGATHYLDITGELAVFEAARSRHKAALDAGIVIIPGVGFDVIPTDCLAARLKQALPDASHLALGFDSKSRLSPGTAKSSIEGLANGGSARIDGQIQPVPLAWHTRPIDFGDGEKLAMTIPWGDVSTAHFTTGIDNIEVYVPASPSMVKQVRRLNWIRPLLGLGWVQNLMKRKVDKTVRGPDQQQRADIPTYVWGEVRNAADETRTARVRTANGYALTVTGSLEVVSFLLGRQVEGGYYTPSKLMDPGLVERLPGSSTIVID
jgi:short subunit dehydrogenase-like uncharacterized protein